MDAASWIQKDTEAQVFLMKDLKSNKAFIELFYYSINGQNCTKYIYILRKMINIFRSIYKCKNEFANHILKIVYSLDTTI